MADEMEIETGGELGPIFAALAKAQGAIKGAIKDSTNPHFKSKYADLGSIWDACREQLSANGLAVVQTPFSLEGNIGIVTMLGHAGGAWIRGRLVVAPTKFDAQGAGSAITYLRRYALAAMVGVAPADDDGEASVGRPAGQATRPKREDFNDKKATVADDPPPASARVYKVVGVDGEPSVFPSADKACHFFMAGAQEAARRDPTGNLLDVHWESNTLSPQLRDAGLDELADKLHARYDEVHSQLADARRDKTAPPESAKTDEPIEPPIVKAEKPLISPLSTAKNKPDWATWAAWVVTQLAASTREEAEAMAKRYEREIKYIRDWRTADADKIDAAMADKY